MNHQTTTKTRFFYACDGVACEVTSKPKGNLTKAADHAKGRGWSIDGNGGPVLCYDCVVIGNAVEERPVTPHLFDHETSGYIAWLSEVDHLDVEAARRELKWVLDALYGAGDGDPNSPRRVDREADWGDAAGNIAERLEDFAPEASDRTCAECGESEAHAPDCDQRPPCPICERRDGHDAGCANR